MFVTSPVPPTLFKFAYFIIPFGSLTWLSDFFLVLVIVVVKVEREKSSCDKLFLIFVSEHAVFYKTH